MITTESGLEARAGFEPGTEPEFEYSLTQIAEPLLALPSLRVHEGAYTKKLDGSMTIEEAQPVEMLTLMIDISLRGYPSERLPKQTPEQVADRLLKKPEALLVVAARAPEYLGKLGLAEGQGGRDTRAVLWNFLGQRIAAEQAASTYELFRPSRVDLIGGSSQHTPSALGPIGREDRLIRMYSAQTLLKSVKRGK